MSRSSPETETDTDQALVLLVDRFAKRLLAKLRLAHANGRHGWEKDDWEVHCQQGLLRHLEKGDPRDVAAYCAFMDHHGWVTVAPQPAGHAQTPADTYRETVRKVAAAREKRRAELQEAVVAAHAAFEAIPIGFPLQQNGRTIDHTLLNEAKRLCELALSDTSTLGNSK